MKRLHIHVKTDDLDKSVGFYTAMFGAPPTKLESDYAKWLLDDPAANISLSTKGSGTGIEHVGISLESREELDAYAERLRPIGAGLFEEDGTTCCYAQSNKYWAKDPQGAVWELFHTFGESSAYGASAPDLSESVQPEPAACCGPNA